MIYYDPTKVWKIQGGQITASNEVTAKKPDHCLVVMDFTEPMRDDDSIDEILLATFADVALATEPTISHAVSTDKRKAELTLTTSSATLGTYVCSVKIVTVLGETIVRKGRLVLS